MLQRKSGRKWKLEEADHIFRGGKQKSGALKKKSNKPKKKETKSNTNKHTGGGTLPCCPLVLQHLFLSTIFYLLHFPGWRLSHLLLILPLAYKVTGFIMAFLYVHNVILGSYRPSPLSYPHPFLMVPFLSRVNFPSLSSPMYFITLLHSPFLSVIVLFWLCYPTCIYVNCNPDFTNKKNTCNICLS